MMSWCPARLRVLAPWDTECICTAWASQRRAAARGGGVRWECHNPAQADSALEAPPSHGPLRPGVHLRVDIGHSRVPRPFLSSKLRMPHKHQPPALAMAQNRQEGPWAGHRVSWLWQQWPGSSDTIALQLVKKLVQAGDTACLQPTLDVFSAEDRQLLQGHCHTHALAILRAGPGATDSRAHTREAIAYLSLAIFAAGRGCPRPRARSCGRCLRGWGGGLC